MAERDILALFFVMVMSAALCGAQSDEELATLCSQIGVVPHPSECTKYVTCATVESGFVARARSCGANLAFNGTSCVPISQVKGCYAPIARRSTIVAATAATECNNAAFSCLDCNTVRKCFKNNLGEYTNPQTSVCPTATPFCDGGFCTNVQSPSCKCSTFRCSEMGVFPDPTNCRFFFICNGLQLLAEYCLQCPTTDYASTTVNDCVKSTECPTSVCPATFTGFQLYTKDPRFYLYCDPSEPKFKYDLYKCPQLQRFDLTSKKCVPALCTFVGKMADPAATTPNAHLTCTAVGVEPKKTSCSPLVFDPTFNRCELATIAKVCTNPPAPEDPDIPE